MPYLKFAIRTEAKKAAQGRKTKAHPEVLLRVLAEEYLKQKA